MDLQSFLRKLSDVAELHARGDFKTAHRLIVTLLEQYPYSVDLLVKRARLEQLLDEPGDGISLESVQAHLQTAHLLQPNAVEPLLELGHLTYVVLDDAKAGLRYFDAALQRAESDLRDALLGKIKCLLELDERTLAQAELENASAYFDGDAELAELSAASLAFDSS